MEEKITLTITMTAEEFDALQYGAWYVGTPAGTPFVGKKKGAAACRAWNILMNQYFLEITKPKEEKS